MFVLKMRYDPQSIGRRSKGMIGRLAVCALLAAQVVPAFAAKDEVEYLIPEDWNSKKDEAKPAGGLPLTS